MKLSDVPAKFNIPFANAAGGGFITYPLPEASQIAISDGRASLTDGFVPLNFQPVGAGGVPPFGKDFNGIMKQVTQWNRWNAAGGLAAWDSAFSTAIGGYPRGALVTGTTTGIMWLSIADDNTNNPNTGGANWIPIFGTSTLVGRIVAVTTTGTTSWTVPEGVVQALVEVISGGGAGGASGDGSAGGLVGNVGAGGGGGGYARKLCTGLTPGGSVSVTVGLGGTGVTDAGGNAGGSSSFGAFCSCTGGAGGVRGTFTTAVGGAGGVATGGDLNITGGIGGNTGPNTATPAVSQVFVPYGRGGYAAGGLSVINSGGTGAAGLGYGAGGSGPTGAPSNAGGNGSQGIVIIRY